MTQTDMILRHMQTFGSITSVEALKEYGCFRLAARIADLRQSYNIETRNVESKNKFGKTVRFAEYRLIGGCLMAWTDQCRIEAVNHVDRKIDDGLTVRDALKAVSDESDIPTGTLTRWKYGKGDVFKNEDKKEKTPVQHWRAVVNRLKKLEEYMEENCMVNADVSPDIIEEFNDLVSTIRLYHQKN